MKNNIKKYLSVFLVFIMISNLGVYAETTEEPDEDKSSSWIDGVGGFFSDAWDGVSSTASDAADWVGDTAGEAADWVGNTAGEASDWIGNTASDVADWAGGAADVIGSWASDTWDGISTWAVDVWDDISSWTAQAWEDSLVWVAKTWEDSSEWAAVNWDNFLVWVDTTISGNPYSWMEDTILSNGLYAYDSFASLRTFLRKDPDLDQMHEMYTDLISNLSLTNEDKDLLWKMLQEWANEKEISHLQIVKISLPFIVRLIVEGETVIGDDITFSGPVLGQYLITILEAMDIESSKDADMVCKKLHKTLEDLVRPVIIGDTDQNILVTEDQYYIENFTYADGKYQIVMSVSNADVESEHPLIKGKTLDQIAKQYFNEADFGELSEISLANGNRGQNIDFTYGISEGTATGKAIGVWSSKYNYVFFVVTDKEWINEEFESWWASVNLSKDNSIEFEVDMESDGAFYGINQKAQKYTINRIFDEAKFTVKKTGHGWAAENGNNLIDNIKGVIKRNHSIVEGGKNAKDGPDRITHYADKTTLWIQTKYHATASRSIQACFRDGKFRYFDSEGKPMAIEVPADQYEKAVEYMRHRIANGEVQGVTDVDDAVEIVKKGNLTYNQARHIAKAGTVESILYDSAHACITAGTSMGLSAAVGFAINIWNGESFDVAVKESVLQGLKTGGTSFIISVLSSQLAKSSLNSAMIPASQVIVKAMGPKASAILINAFRPAGSAIYGAAAMQSAAKLLRGNIITSTVTFVVLSAGDIADIIRGRISWTQLAKNLSTSAAGVTGGALGYLGGAALGSAVLPGAGTVVGIIIAVAGGWGASEGASALADMIAEDDADEMIRIIEEQFTSIAQEYFLNEEEVNKSVENLQGLLTAEMLKQMYQYYNHEAFARQLIEMSIDPVVADRKYVSLPSEEEYSEYLTDVLEEVYEDISEQTEGEE